ncbi:ABC transporter permease [Paenibacillus sambharensis]|uniref:ABC transporter permease n=1 Tax=Paenibacillus sambharensis TaxID=1803190 RepID=A0A2W1LIZ9_9BACL|nr:ABC transporter permease [Paenibacillus sambharensis]PZD95052.1 ABC transporter permease [Paenibacillus sambharensis]
MSNFKNVVAFTLGNKVRAKSFVITTLVIAIILSIVVNLPYIISQFSSDEVDKLGFIESNVPQVSAELKDYFDTQENSDIKLVSYPDAGSAEANEKALKDAMEAGEIEGYLDFVQPEGSAFPSVVIKSEELLDSMSGAVSAGLNQIKMEMVLQDAKLTDAQREMLFAPVDVSTVQISATGGAGSVGDGKTPEERGLAMGLVYALIIVLFMGVMISGQLIASEITAEKSSRVMEVLVTSVSPLTQMFGKIIGMLLVGLIQIGVYVVVFLINLGLPHNSEMLSEMNIDLSAIDPMLLVYAVIFYFAGYFLYATLFAAVGSIVSRTEDLGQAVMPITFLSLAGFYIAIFGMTTPNATFIEVSSFIPFFSPFIMFLRIGLSDPALWEVLLSIGILFGSIFLFGWLSARIYRTGVLMYGKRPSFKELRKAMKAYKL